MAAMWQRSLRLLPIQKGHGRLAAIACRASSAVSAVPVDGKCFFEKCKARLPVSGLEYFALDRLEDPRVAELPLSIRLLLEASLRTCDGVAVTEEDVEAVLNFRKSAGKVDFSWIPPRVILQDLSGVPVLTDLCAMRDAIAASGGDPRKVNPLKPAYLVVDHSIVADVAGKSDALSRNMEIEFDRNRERFQFLKWAQLSFDNFALSPPGGGIIHQVHCESIARSVMVEGGMAFPDACVGTDSHTPMVNGLGVLGWGVGGLEAEAALLGQPMNMVMPEVVGLELTGALKSGVTATDLVLTVTQRLRQHGVVGKFVEVFGAGAETLSVTDRMTVANMAPEFGATVVLFPVDGKTLDYLLATGRQAEHVALVEEYYKANSLFGANAAAGAFYSSTLELDLSEVVPCVAGPKRPQDRVPLSELKSSFQAALTNERGHTGFGLTRQEADAPAMVEAVGGSREVRHGQLAIAAITSCTNTSNPSVLLAAGLLAKKAVEMGLSTPAHVKTSLAPGSRVVTKYLEAAGLQSYLDALGFQTVGYGCTTCMGNSGDVEPSMQAAADNGVITAAVLSGNRNFEGRVHHSVKANYLASPPLVVAAALAGRIDIDFESEPLGFASDGSPVFLRDVWPLPEEVDAAVAANVRPEMFQEVYHSASNQGGDSWEALPASSGLTFSWDPKSTYLTRPPLLERQQGPICDAYCLLLLGDSVTTDHISPVSVIRSGPAYDFLRQRGVEDKDMSSFGARRGNAEVMVRGTFANPRLFNQAVGKTGAWAVHVPSGEVLHVFDAASRYQQQGHDLVVIAGSEYGNGSSRDWAAKGTALLGVRAVLAKSFERIHRSNLACMGVLPLTFAGAQEIGLTGRELLRIHLPDEMLPGATVKVEAMLSGSQDPPITFEATLRLDTRMEVAYWKSGGILPHVLRKMQNAVIS